MKMKGLYKDFLKPKEKIPKRVDVLVTLSTFAVIGVAWCLCTYTGFIPPLFLPTPDRVLRDLYNFFIHENFIVDVLHSSFRILMGFFIASCVAIPVGVLSGTYKVVHAMTDKIINFFRYLPVAALIPLFILWLGIGDAEKIAVVSVGVFYLTALMATDTVAAVPKELLDSAYTLGATQKEILFKVIIPACLPELIENMSISMGAAWTYLVVAELIAANSGIGFQIIDAMRGLFVGKIFAALLVVGFLGVLFASIFRLINRIFFPWYSYGGWEE